MTQANVEGLQVSLGDVAKLFPCLETFANKAIMIDEEVQSIQDWA